MCELAAVLLVGDVGVSIAGATGFLAIEIGGAEATTGELVLGNPFGPPVAPDGAPVQLPASGIGNDFAATPPPPAPAPPPTVGDAPADDGDRRPLPSIGPPETVCEQGHPPPHTACPRSSEQPAVGTESL